LSNSCGWVGKILRVDLSDRTTRNLDTREYGPSYIGGRGIAARIAWDSIPPGIGALDPENLLIIMTGPLTGTSAPTSGRSAVCGLSPQGWPHEWFSRSNFGGHWGASLK
jgi:aldehyde:ferredoxin oxidoreductase